MEYTQPPRGYQLNGKGQGDIYYESMIRKRIDKIRVFKETLLLGEAVLCYKVSAYRASLLLSYLAFIDIIKKRILTSPKPNTVQEGEWNHKIIEKISILPYNGYYG